MTRTSDIKLRFFCWTSVYLLVQLCFECPELYFNIVLGLVDVTKLDHRLPSVCGNDNLLFCNSSGLQACVLQNDLLSGWYPSSMMSHMCRLLPCLQTSSLNILESSMLTCQNHKGSYLSLCWQRFPNLIFYQPSYFSNVVSWPNFPD